MTFTPSTEPIVLTLPDGSLRRMQVEELPALLPEPTAWVRQAISMGPKGPRTFDWLCLPIWHRGRDDGKHFVLLRRVLKPSPHSNELTISFAPVFAPSPTSLKQLVEVVGCRWCIEEDV